MKQKLILIAMTVVLATNCKNEEKSIKPSVLEVTTFSIKTTVYSPFSLIPLSRLINPGCLLVNLSSTSASRLLNI